MRPLVTFMLATATVGAPQADEMSLSRDARFSAALTDVRGMVEATTDEWGLVVTVTDRRQTRLVATHGYADIERRVPVTADTRFAIGSLSKSFLALTLLQIADEGHFDPSAPIARYLPDFQTRSTFAAITGHSLLTHTSGLPNYLPDVASMRFLIAALEDFEPRYAPGAHFWYSNAGYQLLGYAAERIDKQPYPLILKRRVLDRLGMRATDPQIDARLRGRIATSYVRAADGNRQEAPWFDYVAADGAIVSTAGDMSRYARMLLSRGDTPSGRLVSARAFERFATPVLDDYGYGIDVLEHGSVLAHSGSIAGFQAYLSADLGQGVAVVFLANGPIDTALRDRVIDRLRDGTGGSPRPPRESPSSAFASPASFTGRFVRSDRATLRFTADPSGRLVLQDRGDTLLLVRLARDAWGAYLTPTGPRAFLFFRDPSGTVTDVSEGVSSYAKENVSPATHPAPTSWIRFAGRYMAHGEEGPGVRIFARQGRLLMAYTDSNAPPIPLTADSHDRFRFAEPSYAPELLSFDTVIDGRAQRLILSGMPLYRIDLP
jgi:CubicO group peptidase (beta-lactamase class C family)